MQRLVQLQIHSVSDVLKFAKISKHHQYYLSLTVQETMHGRLLLA